MNKIATVASAAALAAVSMTASAWWANPYQTCLTEEQKQAMAEQHKAAVEQQAKAHEQMMAAHRQMAEQMAARQAEFAKRYQEQGSNLANTGYPGADFPGMPAFGQMPEFPTMPEFGQMPEFPARPQFGQAPNMPEFPAMPEFGQLRGIPEMPAQQGMDQRAGRAMPASVQQRKHVHQAYMAKAKAESKARRERAMEEMQLRRADRLMGPRPQFSRGMAPFPRAQMVSFTQPAPVAKCESAKVETAPAVPVQAAAPAPEDAPAHN